MPLILLTKPEEEPLSLAGAKLFLRLEHDDDDPLVSELIAAARLQVETLTGKRLVRQTWRLVLDQWPDDGIVSLPVAPVSSVEAARLRGPDGSGTELDVSGWTLDGVARLHIAYRPTLLRPFAGIEIDLETGYGGADDVPPGFVQAIRLLVAHWYENRASVSEPGQTMPLAAAALIAPQRAMRL